MSRFGPSALRYVLAISMAGLLLAWPLHQAEHARAAVDVTAQVGPDSGSSPHDTQLTPADPCFWCMVHGEAFAPGGTPPAFRIHAETGMPPLRLSAAWPPHHVSLAAEPRGPPGA